MDERSLFVGCSLIWSQLELTTKTSESQRPTGRRRKEGEYFDMMWNILVLFHVALNFKFNFKLSVALLLVSYHTWKSVSYDCDVNLDVTRILYIRTGSRNFPAL